MSLRESLRARRLDIAARWAELIFATYPEQGAAFLRREMDPFRNPVGSTVRREVVVLLDWLCEDADDAALAPALDRIVRLRAVQDFTPAQAVGFVFLAKRTLADSAAADGPPGAGEMAALLARVDDLALKAFDVYTAARERLAEIRVRQVTARTYSLLRRAGAIEDGGAGDGSEPAVASEPPATKGG